MLPPVLLSARLLEGQHQQDEASDCHTFKSVACVRA